MPANNTFLNFPQPAIGLAIASKALFSLTSCFSISLTCQCCSNTPSHLRTLVKTLPSWLLGPMFDVFWIFLTCLPCCYLRPTHCFAAQNPQTSSVQGNTPWCCSSHGHPCHKNQLRKDGKWCWILYRQSQPRHRMSREGPSCWNESLRTLIWAQGGEKIAVNDIIGFLKLPRNSLYVI